MTLIVPAPLPFDAGHCQAVGQNEMVCRTPSEFSVPSNVTPLSVPPALEEPRPATVPPVIVPP